MATFNHIHALVAVVSPVKCSALATVARQRSVILAAISLPSTPDIIISRLPQLASGNEIESGETVDGIRDGRMDRSVQWICQHENALIQPNRPVLDINMGEYASGGRV